MRVRISYSVELEEVPQQSAEILSEAHHSLIHLSGLMRDLSIDISRGAIDKETILKVVEATRSALGTVDTQLGDAGMIMSGYHDAKKQILEEISNPKPQPEKESMVEVEGKNAV